MVNNINPFSRGYVKGMFSNISNLFKLTVYNNKCESNYDCLLCDHDQTAESVLMKFGKRLVWTPVKDIGYILLQK